jgi:hypothetical protein
MTHLRIDSVRAITYIDVRSIKEKSKMFRQNLTEFGPGFHITFANGNTVSVQWHKAAYCENRGFESLKSSTAEVAAWNAKGEWFKLGENDDVIGYQTPEQVLEILNRFSKVNAE